MGDDLFPRRGKGKLTGLEERKLWALALVLRGGSLAGSKEIVSSCSDFIVGNSWVGEQETQREGLERR